MDMPKLDTRSLDIGSSLSSQIPECARESHTGEQRLGLIDRMPSPFRLELVLVPPVSQSPALLGREGRAPLKVSGLAPTIQMLFGPEEQHRASGEADVVPPVVRGDREVDDAFAPRQPAAH